MGIQTRVVNIPGNAGSVSNGVYTNGDQTIGGVKTFNQKINLPSVGESFIEGGTGDDATRTTYNVAFKSWNGLAFKAHDNSVNRVLDCRTGQFKSACGAAFLPEYACRAWVRFNGIGTVGIVGAGNVSSITDHGVGHYQVNFINGMPDASYNVLATVTLSDGVPGNVTSSNGTVSAQNYDPNNVRVTVGDNNTEGSLDAAVVNVAIFR